MTTHVMVSGAAPVLYASPSPPSNKVVNYHEKQSLVLGIIQVISGVLVFICNIVAYPVLSFGSVSGAGFYCGIIFVIAGAFGIAAGKGSRRGFVVTFMVMSIIGAVLVWAIVITSAVCIPLDLYAATYTYSSYNSYSSSYGYIKYGNDAGVGVMSVMLIVGLVQVVVTIWSAAIGCCGVCCNSSSEGRVQTGVYTNQGFVQTGQGSTTVLTTPLQYGQPGIQQQQAYPMQPGYPQQGYPQQGYPQQGYPAPQPDQAVQQPPAYETKPE